MKVVFGKSIWFCTLALKNNDESMIASDGSPASLDAVNEYCRLSASNPHEVTILTVDDVQPYGVLNEEMRQSVETIAKANRCRSVCGIGVGTQKARTFCELRRAFWPCCQ